MAASKILLIDDETDFLKLLSSIFQQEGYQVLAAEDGEKGVELYQREMPDVVICDFMLPKMDGLNVLKKIREIDSDAAFILLTAYGTSKSAEEATSLGAFGHMRKPFDFRELLLTVSKALEARTLKKEVDWLRDETLKKAHETLIGGTPLMREVITLIGKVAASDAPTVLIQGETGTGKNSVARLIHLLSKRSHLPFMEINCASLPETLIESELFGHMRGAFTDAKQAKPGLFEVARGGTVFLDEIAEMSPATQAKLLHVIENRKFRRLGGIEDLETDARVIAAASKDLKEEVSKKRFREDLYFRLQLIPISLPPLRERADDIPPFIERFLAKFNQDYHRNFKDISPEALAMLESYRWPGNIRELKNVIERIAILENKERIEVFHLPQEIRAAGNEPAPEYRIPESGIQLNEVERSLLRQALAKAAGNQSQAAKLLGISRHTLRYRMEKFGLN